MNENEVMPLDQQPVYIPLSVQNRHVIPTKDKIGSILITSSSWNKGIAGQIRVGDKLYVGYDEYRVDYIEKWMRRVSANEVQETMHYKCTPTGSNIKNAFPKDLEKEELKGEQS